MLVPNPFNPWIGWYFARLTELGRYPTGMDAVQAHVNRMYGRPARVQLFPATDLTPKTYIAYAEGKLSICLGGLPSFVCGDRLLGGWSERRNQRGILGVNRMVAETAGNVLDYIDTFGVPQWDQVYISGYSYGGAVAFALAANLRSQRQATTIVVSTFGGPRPADDRLIPHLTNVDAMRWMNLGDPIPLVPPKGDETQGQVALSRLVTWSNADEFVHPSVGAMLSEQPYYFVNDTGAILPADYNLSVLSWIASALSAPGTEHQIATYETRLDEAKRRVPEPGEVEQGAQGPLLPPRGGIVSPPRVPITPQQMIQSPPVGNATVNILPATPTLPATPEFLIRQGPARSKGIYYAEKILGRWYVSTGGSQLWQLRSRREARSTANRLNRMLVTFDRSDYKNEQAFEESIVRNFNS